MRFLSVVVGLFILVQLQACATLNENECRSADWEIIGMEDGAAGRGTSYLGEHRSACADYGVSPDLERYLQGHKRGLVQYCTYDRGYNLAEYGRSFNAVCSQSEYPEFSQGYEKGSQAYEFKSEINRLQSNLDAITADLSGLDNLIYQKEERLVSATISSEERRALLNEVKELNLEVGYLQEQMAEVEMQLSRAVRRYETFKQQG